MIIPSIGRTVHFVLPNGQHVPAIITRVHVSRAQGSRVTEDSLVNLQVFTDEKKTPVVHESRVSQAQANKQPGTWHAPEIV